MRKDAVVKRMNAQRKGKNMKKLVVAMGVAAILSGCVAVRQNDGGESKSVHREGQDPREVRSGEGQGGIR